MKNGAPRGATGGCPPDNVCGGRPRDPRASGESGRLYGFDTDPAG